MAKPEETRNVVNTITEKQKALIDPCLKKLEAILGSLSVKYKIYPTEHVSPNPAQVIQDGIELGVIATPVLERGIVRFDFVLGGEVRGLRDLLRSEVKKIGEVEQASPYVDLCLIMKSGQISNSGWLGSFGA